MLAEIVRKPTRRVAAALGSSANAASERERTKQECPQVSISAKSEESSAPQSIRARPLSVVSFDSWARPGVAPGGEYAPQQRAQRDELTSVGCSRQRIGYEKEHKSRRQTVAGRLAVVIAARSGAARTASCQSSGFSHRSCATRSFSPDCASNLMTAMRNTSRRAPWKWPGTSQRGDCKDKMFSSAGSLASERLQQWHRW